MKKIFIFIVCTLFAITTNAQAPNFFDFQSLVRGSDGKFLKTQNIGVRISILQSSITGTVVYTETHTVTTNANGLLTLTVGTGTTSDNFSAIDWSAGPYFLKTEMDLSGGTTYTVSSTTQMMSVPYALYANTAGNYESRLAALEARADALETTMSTIQSPTYQAKGFSIEPHRQVQFSTGNLRYTYSTKKYSFAPQQYTSSESTTAIGNQSGTTYVFNHFSKSGTVSSSTTEDDTYRPSNDEHTMLDIAYYASADIGQGWFTLSYEHWDYLIHCRPNAKKLYSRATVNGVTGFIILPDGWSLPSGLTFKAAQSSWTTNTYTTAQWNDMQSAGAVFLPDVTTSSSKGYRCASRVYDRPSGVDQLGSIMYPKFSFVSSANGSFVYSGAGTGNSAYGYVRLVKDY